jgi:hypothetical protein
MDIPLNVKVECTDGVCGRSIFVLIDPAIERLTHLIVGDELSNLTGYMVPIDFVSVTIAGTIQLRCTKADLKKMDPFIPTRFIQQEVSNYIWNRGYGWEKSYYWPYVVSAKRSGDPSVQGLSIPVKEMAIGRGTRVEASDGYVGNVDEFVVNPENGTITHMVMREGHLWGKKDVIIPLSALGETREGIMFLNLDKHQIESLPTFPVHRLWS